MLNSRKMQVYQWFCRIVLHKERDKGATAVKKIKQLFLPENGRILVVSDIHGELELFEQLLKKVKFNKNDYLIINGDLCEKGQNSMGTVNYVMQLSANNPNVHVIEGNCEALVDELLSENPKLVDYLLARKHSIFHEWLEHLGHRVDENTKIQEIKTILTRNFAKEINWLHELPTLIETDDYLFVHAGVEDIENWQDTKREVAISLPAFFEKSHRTEKFVIVGHYPVVNYSSEVSANNPIIDRTRKMISIDGGNVVKTSGQLNAFIIHRTSRKDEFSYTYVDPFPVCKVVKDFKAEPKRSGSIVFPNYEIIPLEKGCDFTLCHHPSTNQMLYVKNEYIHKEDNGKYTASDDVPCSFLSIHKGEYVSVIDDRCTGYSLIKKEGTLGWVPKDTLDLMR